MSYEYMLSSLFQFMPSTRTILHFLFVQFLIQRVNTIGRGLLPIMFRNSSKCNIAIVALCLVENEKT